LRIRRHYPIIFDIRGKENQIMAARTSWEILEEPNKILIDEDYRPMELVIFLLTWGVEIALLFTVAIVYLRG
jgi:hypothetical protein